MICNLCGLLKSKILKKKKQVNVRNLLSIFMNKNSKIYYNSMYTESFLSVLQ